MMQSEFAEPAPTAVWACRSRFCRHRGPFWSREHQGRQARRRQAPRPQVPRVLEPRRRRAPQRRSSFIQFLREMRLAPKALAMSFRPARFTDIQRSGPPTTRDGVEWTVRVSAQPPPNGSAFFDKDAGGEDGIGGARWTVNVQFVELRLREQPRRAAASGGAGRPAHPSRQRRLSPVAERAHRRGQRAGARTRITEADRVRGPEQAPQNL